jgi:hypothetical protein
MFERIRTELPEHKVAEETLRLYVRKRKRELGWSTRATCVPQSYALEVAALRAKWQTLFGSEPSPSLGHQFMIPALAYRLQESAQPRSSANSPDGA